MATDEALPEYPKWDYQEYPKLLPRDDFWGQVRRTVMGRRITEDQVMLLVRHIADLLIVSPDDVLLDLGCGNGALSARLFESCAAFVGVDASPYLIEVAKEFFERSPTHVFVENDALSFVATADRPERFTKCLCYALLQYLTPGAVAAVLRGLHERFPELRRVLIGNLPNREKASVFFVSGHSDEQLDEPKSQIGRWWSKAEFASLAAETGWKARVLDMPPDMFNAAYRFDVVLTKG